MVIEVEVEDERSEAREKEYIKWWIDQIFSAKKFRKDTFKAMRRCSSLVRGKQWDGQQENDCRYVVNVIQSEIQAATSSIYAKNPTFVAKRKKRLDFKLWDENQKTLEEAYQAFVATGDPAAGAIIADVQEGKKKRMVLDRIARTLELVIQHEIEQQIPNFKQEMKQLIRRVETCKVGFVKLDFQRLGEVKPEENTRVNDLASRMSYIGALDSKDTENTEIKKEEKVVAENSLFESPLVITKEGLLFHFPRSNALIIDPACSQLRGFVGARWIAEEFLLPATTIKQVYGVDVKGKADSYAFADTSETKWKKKEKEDKQEYDDLYCVYEVYHKDAGVVFTLCEGYDEYLKEPAPPKLILERFFPYYSLTFNDVEDDDDIYPQSTVELIEHQQKEINRAKEALRQHRIASKPQYATLEGALVEEDMKTLDAAPAHAVLNLNPVNGEQDVAKLIQQIKKHGIDPNVYETASFMDDIRRVTRRSDAMLGGVSNSSATADTIAEDARQAEDKSKADDLDMLLTELARDAGTVLMMEMSEETVKKIAGEGAMWVGLTPQDMIQDLYLDIQAGSSGRPNRALEMANFQRVAPILMQMPNLNQEWFTKLAVKIFDPSVDLSEAYLEGMPSVQSMNTMIQQQQQFTGNPEQDPNLQGQEGAMNAPLPPEPNNDMGISLGVNENM